MVCDLLFSLCEAINVIIPDTREHKSIFRVLAIHEKEENLHKLIWLTIDLKGPGYRN